jgi:hypothetical protein
MMTILDQEKTRLQEEAVRGDDDCCREYASFADSHRTLRPELDEDAMIALLDGEIYTESVEGRLVFEIEADEEALETEPEIVAEAAVEVSVPDDIVDAVIADNFAALPKRSFHKEIEAKHRCLKREMRLPSTGWKNNCRKPRQWLQRAA